MWYRIELNKDGGMRSCVEVSGSLLEGRSVHYVEADSKESAIAILASAWVKRKEKLVSNMKARKAAHAAAGLCGLCSRPQVPGLLLCQKHRDERKTARTDADYSPKRKQRKPKITIEEQALAMARTKERERLRNRTCSSLYVRRKILIAVQNTYLANPETFAAWLDAEIAEAHAAVREARDLANALSRAYASSQAAE